MTDGMAIANYYLKTDYDAVGQKKLDAHSIRSDQARLVLINHFN